MYGTLATTSDYSTGRVRISRVSQPSRFDLRPKEAPSSPKRFPVVHPKVGIPLADRISFLSLHAFFLAVVSRIYVLDFIDVFEDLSIHPFDDDVEARSSIETPC